MSAERSDSLREIVGQKISPVLENLPEPQFSPQSLHILKERYLFRNEEKGIQETPKELLLRVAYNIAIAERLWVTETGDEVYLEVAKEFYKLMANCEFLPNSPTLMNAGRDLQQLSACFVLPVEDSMESIFEAVKNTALIHKSGGGTGFSFSRLRPEGDPVGSTSGVASGPVSFMRAFDVVTDVTKQGGTRRGANMGILSVDHPDILKFISAKEGENALTNFNISVAVTEEFMKAVEEGQDYNLVNPRTGKVTGQLNAKNVFNKIVEGAWRNGDPGLVFIDRINQDNPTPHLGRIESTNPCGEQPLLPYESCNLGSINLAKMVEEKKINWPKLARTTRLAVRFLDDVIDMNKYPLSKIEEMTLGNRKIGLGIMGFAEMLVKLGISYDSEAGIKMAEEVMRRINEEALKASLDLAKERGVFPNFKDSIYDTGDLGLGVRNATLTTIAPTGTISMIADCSSGIEPLYALAYKKNVVGGVDYEVNPLFVDMAKERGFYSEELIKKVTEKGSVRSLPEVPDDVQRLFATAHDITPEWHVRMQAIFQRYTGNAVSKTVNLPNEATPADVRQAYLQAWELGCKGITVYRDGSREKQILITKEEPKELFLRPTTEAVKAWPGGMETEFGNFEITIKEDENGIPLKVSVDEFDPGSDALAMTVGITRVVSLGLRSVPPNQAFEKLDLFKAQLLGIGGDSSASPERLPSVPDALGRIFAKYLNEKRPQIESRRDQEKIQLRPLPEVAHGETRRIETPAGKLHVTINRDGAGVLETFTQIGKGSGPVGGLTEGLARAISLELRTTHPSLALVKFRLIENEVSGIGGSSSVGFGPNKVRSVPDGLGQVIGRYINSHPNNNGENSKKRENRGNLCPDCHKPLVHEEGCEKCPSCGYSKC